MAVQRILAFGDSLTEGYYNGGMGFHPYSQKLTELFGQAGVDVKVHQHGVSGECVVGGMGDRLPLVLQQTELEGKRYEWAVVLGGINDLGYGATARRTYGGLKELYGMCHAHGARVLALTCLQTAWTKPGEVDERSKLNDLIRDAPKEMPYVKVADLEAALPYPSDSDKEGQACWDDGLHLTPKGYDVIAQVVFDALKDSLAAPPPQQQAAASAAAQ
ncbi:hypothetical protein HYH03_004470 [Edaphochlamys debaryana]|uniref:SGNH hydrolase-type esterase domain-containing protein n=1 Tax=Edaphochlamys debaryana TaxID=47281 RepID=A0A835YBF1_9CHLO|nr:hypothetical protein HYH03_004470 [Edaphochlamys debaryana]|eukprot:KAG2497736.1 hypothetical protein HYH03_004470 [Edaphochlamys debaryana]